LPFDLPVRINQSIGASKPSSLRKRKSFLGFITFLSRQLSFAVGFSTCEEDFGARISLKTNWRKRVRVERTDDIRDAVRRF
jgi:hypothetical protein